ncbi:MAG: glycosyltransferase, partial [Muribaculaceae bacterium]|nr:glycosyltransferase [Muribaculaceae bacterium]
GIDLDHYNPELPEVKNAAAKIRKDDICTFIFVGRLVGDKGINELVEAFVRLNEEFPSTRLVLVGPEERTLDPLKPGTLAKIASCGSIEAVGSQKDVRPWLTAADVFVFPSYREGFPNVVIEAGAMCLPSIVTDINGSREIIIEGRNGLIIPPKDEELLYQAMKRLLVKPAERTSMATEARPLVSSRYEQAYVRRCLKEYYKEILSNKK